MDYILLKRGNDWIVGRARPHLAHVFDAVEAFPTRRAAEKFIGERRAEQPRTLTLTFGDTPAVGPQIIVVDDDG
ncbi:MAG: hypothetical protein U0837_12910 [Dehalococcoidia bacterium]